MADEKACGAIIFTNVGNVRKYVILCGVGAYRGNYGFPKGHVEAGETEEQTAVRECLEETNTTVTVIDGYREEIGYYMEEYDAYKTVVYFVGRIENDSFVKQESEISDIFLCGADEAMEKLSYENSKELFAKAVEFIKNNVIR